MIFAVIISIMIMTMTTININHNNNHHHQVIITNTITMTTSSIIILKFTLQQKHPPLAEAWSNWKQIKKSKRNRNSELAGVFRSCVFLLFKVSLFNYCLNVDQISTKNNMKVYFTPFLGHSLFLFFLMNLFFPKFNRFSPPPMLRPIQARPCRRNRRRERQIESRRRRSRRKMAILVAGNPGLKPPEINDTPPSTPNWQCS